MKRYMVAVLAIIVAAGCIPSPAQAAQSSSSHVGLPVDWSFKHLLHSRAETPEFTQSASREPRLLLNWQARHQAGAARQIARRGSVKSATKADWNFTLGAGAVAANMSPAKYTFDVNATAVCTNADPTLADYVIYGLNVAGTATQPNLVGFTGLYVNPGGTGFCAGTAPTVSWAYNVTTGTGGSIQTSPALSLDGKKVAFIETVTSTAANSCVGAPGNVGPCSIFHVLTLSTTGAGSFSSVSNTYTAVAPASMTSLVYSAAANTNSSPWIDYSSDAAYFGDDNGQLFKTTCVFYCLTSPALATGYSLGSGITVSAAGTKVTSPVLDGTLNFIFIGSSDGKLYRIPLASCPGAGCAAAMLNKVIGVGTAVSADGGIVDSPMVDPTFQSVFTYTGRNAAGNAAAVQTNYALATTITLTMGTHLFDVHLGAFDDTYYNNTVGGLAATGRFYILGPNTGSHQLNLWSSAFTNANAPTTLSTANPPVWTNLAGAATTSNFNIPGNAATAGTALTEFKNGLVDRLFFGQSAVPKTGCLTAGAGTDGCAFSLVVTGGTAPVATSGNATEHGGTSGIVVDNVSVSTEASSIYFSNQATTGASTGAPNCTIGAGTAAFCAVKLTQSALQ